MGYGSMTLFVFVFGSLLEKVFDACFLKWCKKGCTGSLCLHRMCPVFFACYHLSSLPKEIEKKSSSKHMRALKEDSFEAGFRILLSQDLNFLILLLRKSLDRPAIAAPPGWSHAKAKWGRKSCGANGWNLGKVRGMMGSHVPPPKKSGFV